MGPWFWSKAESKGTPTSAKESACVGERLLELCDELEDLQGDIPRASRNDFYFHKTIAEATNNEFMVAMFDVLEGALMETRVATFGMKPSRIRRVAKAHRAIALAIADRDPDAARQAMLDHLIEVKTTWDQHPEYLTGHPQE